MQSKLLGRLSAQLGKHQAALELKWMKDVAASTDKLEEMVDRRCLRTQPFGPLNLLVRPPVLIPRPETEHWVIRLSEHIQPSSRNPKKLLDLGTGSGCIPLLLCHLWPPGSVHAHGVDLSPHALRLAKDNAFQAQIPPFPSDGLHNTFGTTLTSFLTPTFPDNLPQIRPPFDIITSNPPYIPWKEFVDLPHSVSDFEDPRALFGGPSGLEFYEAIARLISRKDMLSPDAVVALEVGRGQAYAVQELIRSIGRLSHTEIWKDPWGVERTVIGHL